MSYADKLVGLEGFTVQSCVHHLHRNFIEYIQDPEYVVIHEYINCDDFEFGEVYVDSTDEWIRHDIIVYTRSGHKLFTLCEYA